MEKRRELYQTYGEILEEKRQTVRNLLKKASCGRDKTLLSSGDVLWLLYNDERRMKRKEQSRHDD